MTSDQSAPACCARYGRGHDPAFAAAGCLNGTCLVYDVDADEMREVTMAEAAAGIMRYARSLGPGSPACGECERRALALLKPSR